jgi:hypothetical protein
MPITFHSKHLLDDPIDLMPTLRPELGRPVLDTNSGIGGLAILEQRSDPLADPELLDAPIDSLGDVKGAITHL